MDTYAVSLLLDRCLSSEEIRRFIVYKPLGTTSVSIGRVLAATITISGGGEAVTTLGNLVRRIRQAPLRVVGAGSTRVDPGCCHHVAAPGLIYRDDGWIATCLRCDKTWANEPSPLLVAEAVAMMYGRTEQLELINEGDRSGWR